MSKVKKLSRKKLTRGLRSLTSAVSDQLLKVYELQRRVAIVEEGHRKDYDDLARRIAAARHQINDLDRRLSVYLEEPVPYENPAPCEDTSIESSGPDGFNRKQFENEEKIA